MALEPETTLSDDQEKERLEAIASIYRDMEQRLKTAQGQLQELTHQAATTKKTSGLQKVRSLLNTIFSK